MVVFDDKFLFIRENNKYLILRLHSHNISPEKVVCMKKIILPLIILCSTISFSQGNSKAMFRGGLLHSGVYEGSFKGAPEEFAWMYKTGGPVRSTPVHYQDKIIFGSTDGSLYAVKAETGEFLWAFKTGGAVNSSPSVDKDGRIYFLSGDNYFYCLNSDNGTMLWKFKTGEDLPYRWGFDYLQSSPALYEDEVYFGSGDGNLYSLDRNSGSLVWKYFTGNRIRTSPSVYKDMVLFGDMGGHFYSVKSGDGTLIWKFNTIAGTSGNNLGEEAFDRTAIISSPSIEDSTVCFGARDGFLYALNVFTGKELWKFDHQVSWVISTPAIYRHTVFTGSSDGHFVQAVDISSGKEKWRSDTPGLVWSSPSISNDRVYLGDGKGNLFQLDADSGKAEWRFKFSKWILSSVILYDDLLCFGCDDGYVYAVRGNGKVNSPEPLKAVFWEDTHEYKWFKNNIDQYVRDYFTGEGYEVFNSGQLEQFMRQRIIDHRRSIVIFASNRVPYNLIPDTSNDNLFIDYMKSGGKAVFAGNNPLGYIRNPETNKLEAVDYTVASKILGINFKGIVTDALRGMYPSFPTSNGKKLGLKHWWTGFGGVDPGQVTSVLALNEINEASAWIKNYGGPDDSGLMQLWIDNSVPEDLTFIQQAAEFSH